MGVEDDGNFLGSDWDPLLLVNQSVDFNGSVGLSSYDVDLAISQGMCSFNRIEPMLKPSYLATESFSHVVSSLPLPSSSHITNVQCLPDFSSTDVHGLEKNPKVKKRKSLPLEQIQNNEAEQQKDTSPGASPRVKDEKQQKTEPNLGVNSQKPTAKNSKEISQNGDSMKEDYIHVRAKRGQATNSHSLAERLRRERISERMRLLQDLVPGCNKITGKAVMLDEIINYVQSLQRQVEFLSMKLATVNPELNLDIEQILSKDVLHSREGSSAVLGLNPGLSNHHPQFHGSTPQGVKQAEVLMCSIPNPGDMLRVPTPQMSSMAQWLQISTVWGHELQNVFPVNYIPNPPLDNKEQTGSMKAEL